MSKRKKLVVPVQSVEPVTVSSSAPPPPPPPAAAKATDTITLSDWEQEERDQLQVMSTYGDVTVSQFRDTCGLDSTAIDVLNQLIATGFVKRTYQLNAGKYSLTPEGAQRLEALSR